MCDDGVLGMNQERIAAQVDSWISESEGFTGRFEVTEDRVLRIIRQLNANCAPGIDGVTSEHLKMATSPSLCRILSQLFSNIISLKVVPEPFKIGMIIPILKKPGLNTNDPCNFRPVTLSSTFAKVLELLILPSRVRN